MLLALAVLLAFTPLALAHAELLEATPAPGTNFRWSRPGEVRLRFSQQLDGEATSIRLINSRTFAEVAVGESGIDPADPYIAVATLPDMEPGLYTVAWKTKSVDGHTLEGSYEFNVSPREPVVTLAVATVVLTFMGLLVFTRRAGPDDLAE
ncbi:MAG TPA: copper resistance CopC family protein [Ardenticatenaceae bacterium]|jgi:methionine-rich copper-binding protein CopC